MKRNYILAAFMAAFALVSCSKEVAQPEENPQVSEDVKLVKVSMSASSQTKTTLDGQKILWESGDKIAVCYGTTIQEFTLTAGEGTTTARFEGQIDENVTSVTAIYPYNAAVVNGSAVTAAVPAEQTVNSANGHCVVMKAENVEVTKEGEEYKIDHANLGFASALMKVKVGAGVDHIVLHSVPGSEGVCGALTGSSPSISVKISNPAEEAATYGIAVPAGEFPAFRIFWGKDDAENSNANHKDWKMLQSGSSVSLVAGALFDLGDVSDNGVSVSVITCRKDINGLEGGGTYILSSKPYYILNDFNIGAGVGNKINVTGTTLDGQGHTISGIAENQAYYACLFNSISGASAVKNITFGTEGAHGSMIQTGEGTYGIGGIFRWMEGTSVLENITSYVDVTMSANVTKGAYVAGVLAQNRSTAPVSVKNCKNYGSILLNAETISSDYIVGGVVAQSTSSTKIQGCQNNGKVSNEINTAYANKVYMGGCFGYVKTTSIEDCTNNAQVASSSADGTASRSAYLALGGVAGYLNETAVTMTGCTNNGEVSNNIPSSNLVNIGGVVGYIGENSNSTLTDCSNTAAVSNTGNNSYNSEWGALNMGGIVGMTWGVVSMTGCANSGAVKDESASTVYSNLGGVAGKLNLKATGLSLTRCSNTAAVVRGSTASTCTSTYIYIGGIAGMVRDADGANFDSCSNSGMLTNRAYAVSIAATPTSQIFVGGISGFTKVAAGYKDCTNTAKIENYVSANSTTADKGVALGGILGFAGDATVAKAVNVDNCDVTGSTADVRDYSSRIVPVSGTETTINNYIKIGGIVGVYASNGTIRNCDCAASLQKTANSFYNLDMGGIVGHCGYYAATDINNCKYTKWMVATSSSANQTFMGGIAGNIVVASPLTDCANSGSVQAKGTTITEKYCYMGGIVGSLNEQITISGCTNSAIVENQAKNTTGNGLRVGGIAGGINASKGTAGTNPVITGCTNTGKVFNSNAGVTVKHSFGGIIGYTAGGSATITDSNVNCVVSSASSSTPQIGIVLGQDAYGNVTGTGIKVKGTVGSTVLTESNYSGYLSTLADGRTSKLTGVSFWQ